MFPPKHKMFQEWIFVAAAVVLSCAVCEPAQQQQQQPQETPEFNLIVMVKEADTGNPISQARLTVTFKQPGKLHRTVSYGAKTDAQGQYRFTSIPKGTVQVYVTAEHRQTFGREIELEKDNQVVEVKLKKPQPLL